MSHFLKATGQNFFLIAAMWSLPFMALADIPSFAEIKSGFHSSYAELLDRNGVVLHGRRLDPKINRLRWVPLKEISPALSEAVIFVEDKEFFDHKGIDWSATALAALKYATGDKSRGASTISMQLAGLLNTELAWRQGGRSFAQKWDQMRSARELEKEWTKTEILEAYFNLVTWRGDLQGIDAASRALFGKSAIGLDRTESILLAASLASPSAAPGRIAQRSCTQIAAGFENASCQKAESLAALHFNRRLSPYAESPALDALSARLLKTPDTAVRTTLDGSLQKYASEMLGAHLQELKGSHVNAGAVLVLDNVTGEVLAYVANAGLVDQARFVDGIQAQRQAGSTLKPFFYELAFEKKYLTAASVLEDSPLSLPTPNGLYTPQNYEGDFKGPVTARTALASSLNVPAVRVLDLIGVENGWLRLKELGFTSLNESPDFYGYSLALGSADVSVWMLANAYRALANGGLYGDAIFALNNTPDKRRIMNDEAAFITADILADRSARATTFGLESVLATPFWSAVKTGTSKDMRDNWCVGFSRRYTVAVWVGNMDGAPMRDVSGVSGAAPLWATLMQKLEGGRVTLTGDAPLAPLSLRYQPVSFKGVPEPAREEWFIAGTEMEKVVFVPQIATRIIYPANETIIAIDPDIPDSQQKVRFQIESPQQKGLTWWLNDRPLADAKSYEWTPVPGRHRLVLKDAQGKERDAVFFTVRGGKTPQRQP